MNPKTLHYLSGQSDIGVALFRVYSVCDKIKRTVAG